MPIQQLSNFNIKRNYPKFVKTLIRKIYILILHMWKTASKSYMLVEITLKTIMTVSKLGVN